MHSNFLLKTFEIFRERPRHIEVREVNILEHLEKSN